MVDENNNENIGVPIGGTDGDSQDPIIPDNPIDEDIVSDEDNLVEFEYNQVQVGDTDFPMQIPLGMEEDAFVIDENNEEYDGDMSIVSTYFINTLTNAVLSISSNEELIYTKTVTSSDESLIQNDDNIIFVINLNDVDLTSINNEDEVEFLFNGNEGEEVYKILCTAYNYDEDSKLIFNEAKYYLNQTSVFNQNSSIEDSSDEEEGEEDDWTPSLIVDTNEDESKSMTFQTRVFHENNNEIYGAEIVLIPRDSNVNPIETILITDKIKLDSFNGLVQNMERCYVPYTADDVDNLRIYEKIASGEMSESDMEYRTMKWSKLHEKGDLKTILRNNINLSDSKFEQYDRDDVTVINASHLSGYDSGEFVKVDDLDSLLEGRFVKGGHEFLQASTSRAGHAFIVDNLNETNLSGGKVLSANQGRVLNEKIQSLEGTVNNSWSKERKIGNYLTYKVNEVLRLIVCNYNKSNFKGFQSETGTQILEGKGTIDSNYTPVSNVSTPLIRGDITLTYTKDGEVLINSLTRQNSIDINIQTMWHF